MAGSKDNWEKYKKVVKQGDICCNIHATTGSL